MIPVIAVGLGKRGSRWVGWAKQAGADVIGVVDSNPQTLAEQGGALGFGEGQRFTSIADAVRALQPVAAVACAPNHVHPLIAREGLENGLHVLIEKPLAEQLSTARELVTMAADRNLHLAVAQQFRYSSGPQKLREMVSSGALGARTGGFVQFYRWRPTKGMKLPILLNQAIHHFDAMRYILDSDPIACIADLWDPEWNGCDGPTVVEATFRFADGTRVHYSGSYVARGQITPFDALWRFEGSDGQLTYDGETDVTYTPAESDATQTVEVEERTNVSSVLVAKDFLRAIETGVAPPTSGRDNLHTLAMIFAVEASARLRREVSLEEVMEG